MFTGIIEEIGAISRRSGSDITILAKTVLDGVREGDSIAVDGACLTVVSFTADSFVVQVSPESFKRTTLGRLKVGDAVNLERALSAGARMGGHFVQGHVDGVGRVVSVTPQGEFALWRFQAPSEVARYLVSKGSIAIDGISLTVVDPNNDTFDVAVIPATLQKTTLANRRPNDPVNMEADMLAKHIFQFMRNMSGSGLTIDKLKRHGFA